MRSRCRGQATDLALTQACRRRFAACVRPATMPSTQQPWILFFNNVAVGIRHALDVHGLQRVALVDFDAPRQRQRRHFPGDSRVLMCSIYEQGLYPFSGEQAVGPNMVNVGLPPRSGGDKFRQAVTEQWLPGLKRLHRS